MVDEELDALLVLSDALVKQGKELNEVRQEVLEILLREAWATAMRTRHHLTTQCLDTPSESAWMVLYKFGSDANFINKTSLARSSFHRLLRRFERFYRIPRHDTRGRPVKLLYHHQVLGLILCFYVGSMEQSTLCMMFGAPPSTLSRTLRKAEQALSKAFVGYAPAKISWPSPSRQVELAELVKAREPVLSHTFGSIDGKNLRVQQPSNADLQNAMYNGWLHTVFVTGTICFAADGCIIWNKHSCPGSWNDSDSSIGFRNKLLDPAFYPDARMNVVSDSAFPCSTAMTGRILTPLKDGELERVVPSLRRSAHIKHNAIFSARQAPEWGMGSIENVYHRLFLPLPYNPAWLENQQLVPDGELPRAHSGNLPNSHNVCWWHGTSTVSTAIGQVIEK